MRLGLAIVAGVVLLAAVAYLSAQVLAAVPAAKADRLALVQSSPSPARVPEVARSGRTAEAFRSEPVAEPAELAAQAPLPLPEGPLVAIVMTEMGLDPVRDSEVIAALPPEVTFAFSPYGEQARQAAQKAAADGHEVLVSLPMEPNSYPEVSPGEHTLLAGASPDDNRQALEWALRGFEEIDGTTGMMGSRFTRSPKALAPVMESLSTRGLLFVDQRASTRSVAAEQARIAGVPSRTNDDFVDEPSTNSSVSARLSRLTGIARERGYAIGYARPVPETVEALRSYASGAEGEGVTLVGAARLVRGLSSDS